MVTQPDRPRGRGQVSAASPVKELALAWNLPVLQPQRLKDPELIAAPRRWQPELMMVVAYGRILPRRFWPCRQWASSMSTPRCCPGTGARPPSIGP